MSARKSAILTYHSVDDSGSALSISPAAFRRHLEILSAGNFQVLPLSRLPGVPGSVALTFDDGYRNFLSSALPLLQEFRMPATVFVVSGRCGGYNDWPSLSTIQPRLKLMDWTEIQEISQAGVAIGAHTVTHANLTALPERQAVQEIRDSRSAIEDRIGLPVDTFAYPYGATSAAVRGIASQVFRLACGVGPRFVSPVPDPMDLPRIDAGYVRKRFFMSILHTAMGTAYVDAQRAFDVVKTAWRMRR
jgi:peptidoglycan/xylan/chitin deacetylase (PgdA/CDA1 family)